MAFLLAGVAGFVIVARRRTVFEHDVERWPYAVFFVGLLLTSLGSAYYHLAPDNGRLFWDRLPMTIAFMGLVASQIVDRVSVRAGIVLLVPMLAVGAASVIYWDMTEQAGHGNVLPYAILQGYVMVVLLLIAILYPSRYTRARGLYYVFAWYALSKVLEAFDAEIFGIGHVVSGHTLKHLAAAGSGFTACWMLAGRTIATTRPERPQARRDSLAVSRARQPRAGRVPRVDDACDLLLESSLGVGADRAGGGVPRVRGVGVLGGSPAPRVLGAGRRVCGVLRLVVADPRVARSAMAPRGGRHAARHRRRRPRALHRRAQLRVSQPYAISRRATRSARLSLSHLTGVDFYVSYWAEGVVGHTFVSFIFDNAPPLSVSIETRPEVGEGFDPLASMFKQFELIYVVGDERDIVRAAHQPSRRGSVPLPHRHLARVRPAALHGVRGAHQRARRPAGVLSPALQQLHHQHRPLCQCRGPRRQFRFPASSQRPHRPLPLCRGRRRHVVAVRRAAAAVAHYADCPRGGRRRRLPRANSRRVADANDGFSIGTEHPATLTAHTWELVSAKDAGNAPVAALQPRPGTPVELEFADGRLLASGGCNSLRAAYRFDAGGNLVVDRIVSTQMACDPPLMRIDTALVDFFASPLRIDVTGGDAPRMRLQSATSSTLEFVGRPTPEARYGPATIAFLEVAPAQVACSHPRLAITRCLQVRDVTFDAQGLRAGPPGEWRLLYEPIDGFEHVEGIRSVLRVKRFAARPRPPMRPRRSTSPTLWSSRAQRRSDRQAAALIQNELRLECRTRTFRSSGNQSGLA